MNRESTYIHCAIECWLPAGYGLPQRMITSMFSSVERTFMMMQFMPSIT